MAVTRDGTRQTWSYSGYGAGQYVPRNGTATPTFFNRDSPGVNYVRTNVVFTLDDTNVSNILSYNEGTHPDAPNMNIFLGLDVRSWRNSNSNRDMMDAYIIFTNLPEAKRDLENDDLFSFDNRNEEAEVVALGRVRNQSYYVSTLWYDHRSGGSNHDGQFRVQFHMSGQYLRVPIGGTYRNSNGDRFIDFFGDYNPVWISNVNQAFMPYGSIGGRE